jgi:hypothetical protein
VKNKQSNDCLHCPQNIKGSGQGDSRACRYSQRLAVMIEGETEQEHVYQLVLPATSIFGEGDKNKMPLQQYAKFLSGRGFPIFGVVTEMKFDIDSPTPKLVFKAVRPVTEEEYTTVKRMMTSEEAIKAITLTVAQTDGVKDSSEGFETVAKPRANALAAPKAKAEPEDPIEEPKKASSKKPAAPVQQEASLGELVNEWDD